VGRMRYWTVAQGLIKRGRNGRGIRARGYCSFTPKGRAWSFRAGGGDFGIADANPEPKAKAGGMLMAPLDDDQTNERESRLDELITGYRRHHPRPPDQASEDRQSESDDTANRPERQVPRGRPRR
jgi:hypothetical protein